MDRTAASRSSLSGLYVVIAVAVLYLARSVLIPVAMAILVTFLLAPVVSRLTRLLHSRIAAVSVVSVLLLAVTAALFLGVWGRIYELADNLPAYRAQITQKIHDIRPGTEGVLGRASDALKYIGMEIAGTSGEATPPTSAGRPSAEVQAIEPKSSKLLEFLGAWVPSVAGVIVTICIVVLLSILMLISREDIRNRIIHLAGNNQISLTTQSMEEATQKIRSYLRSQLIINTAFGLVTATGLTLIGVPNAIVLGLFAGALRFIPYLGPWMGALTPILVAFAVFDGWTGVILVAGLFLVAELVANLVFEPLLYGSGTGLSSFGVVVAILFWTWVWGPIGLLLSVPITVCLVVIAKQLPQMEMIQTLLGDQPTLSAAQRLYQRLLSGDEDEAEHVLETSAEAHQEPLKLLDEVLFPALQAAKGDVRRGRIVQAQANEVCEDFAELATDALSCGLKDAKAPTGPVTIACIAARDACDHVASQLFAQVLEAQGLRTRVVSPATSLGGALELIDQESIPVLLVSSVQPGGAARTKLLCKAIWRRFPDIQIYVGAWGSQHVTDGNGKPRIVEGIAAVHNTASGMLRELKALAPFKAVKPEEPAPDLPPIQEKALAQAGG